jgi:hypothetical protein
MFWVSDVDTNQSTKECYFHLRKNILKCHAGNGSDVIKILPHKTAMEFGMADLQSDMQTGVFLIATCLYQRMERVFGCLEITHIKVYRVICL